MRNRVIAGLSIIAGIAVIAAGTLLVLWYVDAHRFDGEAWRAQPGRMCYQYEHRSRMVDDVVEDHLSEGMTRSDVRRLLGEPNTADSTKRTRGWIYFLGNSGGFLWTSGSDCSVLYVGFDGRGRLAEMLVS